MLVICSLKNHHVHNHNLFNSTVSSASGLPDDYNATTVTLSFPPSNDFMPMDYTAPIIADDIHEETEGFFVQILFSFEDTADSNNFDIIREGFAFITIANDDCEC